MYFPDDVVLGPGGVFVFLLYVIRIAWHVLTAGFFLLVDRGAAREVIEAETGSPAPEPGLARDASVDGNLSGLCPTPY